MGLGIRNVQHQKGRIEVSRFRIAQKLLYAEAVKKVEEDGSRGRDPERSDVSSRAVPAQRDRPTSDICFRKVGFLAFIAMAIN
jgi:hypothetical protein